MSELPNGWVRAPLKSLLPHDGIFSDGDWIESKDQDPNGSIRLLQLADIGDGYFVDKSSRFVNEEKFTALNCTELKTGDVLIARMPDPLGRACLLPEMSQPCITVVDVAVFRTGKEGVSNKWLMNAINSPQLRAFMETNSSGTTRKRIARGKLTDMELHVPPFSEQKRIADKLDAVLARVDACRARLDSIPAILKRFRQSVLAAATSGKLTEDWRDENAYSLDDWTINLLGSLVKASANGLSKRRGDIGNETVVLRLADFKNSERVQGNERTIKLDGKELEKYSLTTGDLLVVRVNGSRDLAGKFIIYESRGGEAEAYCDHFIRLRLDRQLVAPQFALFVANSGAGRHYVESVLLTTAGQNTINQTALFGLNIDLPPLEEQTEIVRRVEALFAMADRLEARYTAARAQVEKLTPATLAKAFRGDLVPQDPNDESASVLLERIHAALAAEVGAVKPKLRKVTVKVERKFKAEDIMLELSKVNSDHLTTILNEKGRLAPKVLWQASQLGIEDFYEQLRTEEAKHFLREVREGNDSFLEAA